jgi:hypothetical protein
MLRACGRKSCGEFRRGAGITYLVGPNHTGHRFCECGVLVDVPVYDPLTALTWLPVRPLPARAKSASLWVKCCNVVDISDLGTGNDEQG